MPTAQQLFSQALGTEAQTPSKAPARVSQVLVAQGIAYVVVGLLHYFAPALAMSLAFSPATKQNPGALGTVRNVGLQVAIVGWLYIAGGRGRSPQLVAATIIAHGFLAPPLLLLATLGGLELGFAVVLAATDFLFGNLAWYIYNSEVKGEFTQRSG